MIKDDKKRLDGLAIMMYKDRRNIKKSRVFHALLRRWSEVRILHGSLVNAHPVRNYGVSVFPYVVRTYEV
jgi:hypothetical protein